MLPTLEDGMIISVEKACPEAVKPADIILYKKQTQLIAHRVIKIITRNDKRVFITKGDNQAYVDADYINETEVIGIVRGAFRENNLNEDVLIKNKFIGCLYVIFARLCLAMRNQRKYLPSFIRYLFKPFVGGFFFVIKKIMYIMYLIASRPWQQKCKAQED
jgi:signal peptidase I